MKFESRNLGFGSRQVDINPTDVKRVTDHPSCYKLAIIEMKDGNTVTVQGRPSYVREQVGL